MKTIRLLAALLLASSAVYAQPRPYPNQQQVQALPTALIAPSGNPPAGDAWTPRALLLDPTTGALRVSDVSTSGTTGTERTATTTAKVLSGTITAGCRQITFIASSDFAGTILTNLPLLAGASLTIQANGNDTIGAIAFTRSAGTLYTVELR